MFCVKHHKFRQENTRRKGVGKRHDLSKFDNDVGYRRILDFTFKIYALPTATRPPLPNLVDPFVNMRRKQTTFVTPPLRIVHCKMYANLDAYNDLIAFLEVHEVGWTANTAFTDRKRFVEGMSKAFSVVPRVLGRR